VKSAGVEMAEKLGECEGSENDDGEEAGAVLVVEAVAGFEVRVVVWRAWEVDIWDVDVDVNVEDAGVEEAVGGVDHPDGYEHRGGGSPGKDEVGAAGDEEGPEGGDGWGVEGEKMPEGERGVVRFLRTLRY
jgi:hypothetical protein